MADDGQTTRSKLIALSVLKSDNESNNDECFCKIRNSSKKVCCLSVWFESKQHSNSWFCYLCVCFQPLLSFSTFGWHDCNVYVDDVDMAHDLILAVAHNEQKVIGPETFMLWHMEYVYVLVVRVCRWIQLNEKLSSVFPNFVFYYAEVPITPRLRGKCEH